MTVAHSEVIDQIKSSTDYFQKAKLLNFLVRTQHLRIKDVSASLSMKPSYVCHILRLNKLSELIMDGYYSQLISISHLFVLSLLHSQEDIMELYEKVLQNNLSVKDTEELVRMKLHNVTSEGDYIESAKLDEIKEKVEKLYGVSVKIVQTRIKTKILLEWNGNRASRKKDVLKLLQTLLTKSHSEGE